MVANKDTATPTIAVEERPTKTKAQAQDTEKQTQA